MSGVRWFGSCGVLIGILLIATAADGAAAPSEKVLLHNNWSLQSSCQVKAPGEVKEPWDYIQILNTIPAAQAFQPVSETLCNMAH